MSFSSYLVNRLQINDWLQYPITPSPITNLTYTSGSTTIQNITDVLSEGFYGVSFQYTFQAASGDSIKYYTVGLFCPNSEFGSSSFTSKPNGLNIKQNGAGLTVGGVNSVSNTLTGFFYSDGNPNAKVSTNISVGSTNGGDIDLLCYNASGTGLYIYKIV